MDQKILLLLLLELIQSARAQYSTVSDILENTNKRLPNQNTTKPLDVRLGFYLESIGNFRAEEMSFDVDMYAYLSWNDWRLRHHFNDFVLVNDDNIRQQLWLPDLYFANAIKSKAHDVTVPNFNMFIDRDGTVAYSCRFTMQISCNLELENYPMDEQTCGIRILSYAYIAKQVNVSWFDKNPIRYNPSIGLPEFNITNVSPGYCNGTYRYAMMPDRYKVDVFSCLLGNVHLARSIGYNLVQSYIPTGLIVMISWVSFWIDRRAVPARVTLSFTTLVSLTTLGNGLRFGLPQVSYAKAIDYWYGACMLFVFCALLEFAIINSYMRKAEKYGEMAKKFLHSRMNNNESAEVKKEMESMENGQDRKKSVSKSPKGTHRSPKPSRSPNRSPLLNHAPPANSFSPSDPRLRSRLRLTGDRIRFADEELPMTVLNGKENASMSSYDNLSPRHRGTVHLRREDLDISDDDEERFDRAVQQRNKPFVVYATDNGTAIFYNAMSKSFSRTALCIDKACRYAFPLVFVLWNFFYWWFYLCWRKGDALCHVFGEE